MEFHLLIFIYNEKKNYNSIIHYVNCIIFAHIPKINSIVTSFNRNNSNIIEIYSFKP